MCKVGRKGGGSLYVALSGVGLISHLMKFFTFCIIACTKCSVSFVGRASMGVAVGVGCNKIH